MTLTNGPTGGSESCCVTLGWSFSLCKRVSPLQNEGLASEDPERALTFYERTDTTTANSALTEQKRGGLGKGAGRMPRMQPGFLF